MCSISARQSGRGTSARRDKYRRGNMPMIALLPELNFDDSVFVTASNRFIKAFVATWQRIPADAKNVIMDYLGLRPGRAFLCFAMDLGDLPVEPLGRCSISENEIVFTFLAPYIQHAADPEGVFAVIAHELAHCHNHAMGTWTSNEAEEEQNTRRLAESWGFHPEPVPNPELLAGIERWKVSRKLEFGEHTEKRVFSLS